MFVLGKYIIGCDYVGCIYAHILRNETSKENGWMYIGQARDLKKRWNRKENSYRECSFIHRALAKYGWEAFEHIVLEDNIPDELLDEREAHWIKEYHTFQGDPEYTGGFNLTSGGKSNTAVHPTMKGIVPKNINDLAEMKKKPIRCLNSGIIDGISYSKNQIWSCQAECGNYFRKAVSWVQHRLYGEWDILSGPAFAFCDEDVEFDENEIQERKNKIKANQKLSGKTLSSKHKTGSRIEYFIYCEETKQVFKKVSDCLKEFSMARATLNGHINYPEKHKTAKGYHFKRIPKTTVSD